MAGLSYTDGAHYTMWSSAQVIDSLLQWSERQTPKIEQRLDCMRKGANPNTAESHCRLLASYSLWVIEFAPRFADGRQAFPWRY